MESLKIHYTRRQTQKLGEDFETSEIGADWEFPMLDGADVDQEFGKAWIVLRGTVDRHFEVGDDVQTEAPKQESYPERHKRQSRELQQSVFESEKTAKPAVDEEYRTFESGTNGADIVENEPVFLGNAKVWEAKEDSTRTGKRFGFARIGSKDRIPTGYARVKSYEPPLINKITALAEGDYVDIWGHYESWMGRESEEGKPETYMWDFIPERIEKRPKRS